MLPGSKPVVHVGEISPEAMEVDERSEGTMSLGNSLKVAGLAAVLGVAGLSQSAEAALLAPGATLYPAPGEANPVGGTTLATVTSPFVASTFSGTLVTSVISGDTSNPFGGLTFTYRLTNNSSSTTDINRLTVTDFGGFQTDASHLVGALLAPTLIDRGVGAGNEVGFSFHGQPVGPSALTPGLGSGTLVIQTNATLFAPSLANVINGSVASVPSLGPAVPEPGSLALVGAVGLLAMRRRRA